MAFSSSRVTDGAVTLRKRIASGDAAREADWLCTGDGVLGGGGDRGGVGGMCTPLGIGGRMMRTLFL